MFTQFLNEFSDQCFLEKYQLIAAEIIQIFIDLKKKILALPMILMNKANWLINIFPLCKSDTFHPQIPAERQWRANNNCQATIITHCINMMHFIYFEIPI